MTDLFPVKDPVLVFALVALLILLAPIVMGRWRLPGMLGLLIAGAVLGPNALHVLERDQSFVLFGTVGLLYIMFIAALEIDMAVLRRYGGHSLVFGLLTFALPQGAGMLVGHLLGFDWPAAILLGAVFASHTLIAYPIVSRLGLARNPAVTATVGGTILTDTVALLVLAVIADYTRGHVGELFWYRLGLGLALYVGVILVGLPRLARWFFRNVGGDSVAEFVFVLATVFACASLAHVAGAEPIVGAFLAGLALNRLIPHNGTLMNRLRFTGEAVFIPFFLLSVGMLLDVRIFFGELHALMIAIAMVVVVTATKWLAAEATRVLLGYGREQARVVFGLSVAHAAATLAATIVGYDIGLFDEAVVNGAILMILVTCALAPWLVERHGRTIALAAAEAVAEPAGPPQRILVALSKPAAASSLLELAQIVRDPEQRQPVYPLTVIEGSDGASEEIVRAERMLADAVHRLAAAEVPAQPVTRVDLSFPDGVLRARRDLRGTKLIVGWSGKTTAPELFFGSMLERLLRDRDYTLIVSRTVEPLASCRRIVFAVPPNAAHEKGFAEAAGIVRRLARELGGELLILAEKRDESSLRKRLQAIRPAAEMRLSALESWSDVIPAFAKNSAAADLFVLYGVRIGGLAWRPALSNLPTRVAEHFPAANLLVIYPHEFERESQTRPLAGASLV